MESMDPLRAERGDEPGCGRRGVRAAGDEDKDVATLTDQAAGDDHAGQFVERLRHGRRGGFHAAILRRADYPKSSRLPESDPSARRARATNSSTGSGKPLRSTRPIGSNSRYADAPIESTIPVVTITS